MVPGMKSFYSIMFSAVALAFFSFTTRAQEPSLQWVKQLGGTNDDEAYDMAIDSLGNVYTIGRFYASGDYNPGTGVYNLVSAGKYDVFISKVTANGDFVWAKHFGGLEDEEGTAIAVDDSGNVVITGYFSGVSDFDPGAGVFNMSPISNLDIFIVKVNPSGNLVWAKQLGGPGYGTRSQDIATDKNGNVYVTGAFSQTLDFDPGSGAVNKTATGADDIFILKLDPSGEFEWVKQMGGVFNDGAASLAIDDSGNILTTGYFTGPADFDPGTATYHLSTQGGHAAFISKLDSLGDFVWAGQLGGSSSYAQCNGRSITFDKSGNVYTTGFFRGKVDFDPGSDTFHLDAGLHDNIYVSKLDATGDFVWSKQMGGDNQDIGTSVSVDSAGNVYTTGTFQGTADFDPGAGTYPLNAAGEEDIFISKLDSGGDFVSAKRFGNPGIDNGTSIQCYKNNTVYTSGYFKGVVDFNGNSEVFNLTAAGIFDVFLHKMAPCNLVASATLHGSTLSADVTGASYQWINCDNGQPIAGATNQSFTPASIGTYAVAIRKNSCRDTSDCYTVDEVGVAIHNLETAAVVYPNPTSGTITIHFDQPIKNARLILTDLLGKKIIEKAANNGHQVHLDLSHLTDGIYFLQLQQNGNVYRSKIIKE